LVLATNDLETPSPHHCERYKARWALSCFFKCAEAKPRVREKSGARGRTKNAVKVQIIYRFESTYLVDCK